MIQTVLRRVRLGVRLTISFVLVVGVLVIAVIAGYQGSRHQQETTRELVHLQRLAHQIDQIKFYNADISGWQTSYGWTATNYGDPVGASEPTSSDRAGITESRNHLNEVMAHLDTGSMTAQEKAELQSLRGFWDEFWQLDDKIVAEFRASRVTEAGDLYTNVYEVYKKIVKSTDSMVASVAGRIDTAARAAENSAGRDQRTMLAMLGLSVALAAFIAWAVTRSITVPMAAAVRTLRRVAARDLTPVEPGAGRDEVAAMSQALGEAVTGVREAVGTMADAATGLQTTSDQVAEVTGQVSDSARDTSTRAAEAAAASDGVLAQVQSLTEGAQQMSASIGEISHNVNRAVEVVAQAVNAAAKTNETVNHLGESSQEITNVVKLITAIAEQTNLLALNATIEAARAGESGKGFAVVANEVKELAQETARATDDISHRVDAIQADTVEAVDAIRRIAAIIEDINGYQHTIASAVEEQTATTDEITRSVTAVAVGTGEITENISGAAGAASTTTDAVAVSQQAVRDLTDTSAQLREVVATFRL